MPGETQGGPDPEEQSTQTTEEVAGGVATEVRAPSTEVDSDGVIQNIDMGSGGGEAQPGPQFREPTAAEQAAHMAEVQAAQAAVEAAAGTEAKPEGGPDQPAASAPNPVAAPRHPEGYNVAADGYTGGRGDEHKLEQAAAADRVAQLNGIPTAAEKAEMRAPDAAPKSGLRKLLDRLRGRS